MAQIKQVGVGRKSIGTIDGITYYVRGGVTYARSTPIIPAKAYNTPEARKRQAAFKLIQMHMRYHLRTIRQTFTPKDNGTPSNSYLSKNYRALTAALDALAERYVAGDIITIDDVEAAICTYATENPKSITIGHLSGYQDVYLTGEWPSTITLNPQAGYSTTIIIVSENGTTTTYNTDGSVTVTNGQTESTENTENPGGSGTNSNPTVTAPTISGTTPFEETTSVTMSGPAGAEIRYTVNGSTPTAESSLYSEALTLSETTTVKAIAIKDGVSSEVMTRTFTKGASGGGLDD